MLNLSLINVEDEYHSGLIFLRKNKGVRTVVEKRLKQLREGGESGVLGEEIQQIW